MLLAPKGCRKRLRPFDICKGSPVHAEHPVRWPRITAHDGQFDLVRSTREEIECASRLE